MKNILLTGGAGFIGSNLSAKLLEMGHRVLSVDNLISGREENISALIGNQNFKFIKHDICQPIDFLPEQIDIIFNLACPASPPFYQKYPLETMNSCSVGVENLLKLAEKYKARFVHTSTSEVYGDPEIHPQVESYRGSVNCYGPRSCYDEGKRYAEALIYIYRQKGVNTGVVRIFNTYGPKMRPDDGRVISNFIMQALENKPITVYGGGQQTRSFCYVDDTVNALIKMSESTLEGPVNLGNPGEFTMLELAEKVIALTGSKSQLVHLDLPKDDPTQRRPDISLAQKGLDWSPKITLEEGLKSAINWFRQYTLKINMTQDIKNNIEIL